MKMQEKVTPDALVEAFQEHLQRARGTDRVSRHQYGRYVRAFLGEVFADGPVDVGALSPPDVVCHILSLVDRYRPRPIRGVTTALRHFFRFLRLKGLRDDRLDEAVPSVTQRKLSGLPRYLDDGQFERLLSSLSGSTPRARRDRAMILCAARRGLRLSPRSPLRSRTTTGLGRTQPLPMKLKRPLSKGVKRNRGRKEPAGRAHHAIFSA